MWRIWIDTGGTFTDCVAVAPDGGTTRWKVLSNSSLRGVVRRGGEPAAPRVDWSVELPDDFLAGQSPAPVAGTGRPVRILTSTTAGALALAAPLGIEAGEACEVRFAEEVPILAARLATGTPPGEPLPPMAMRLATTRATNALLERSGALTLLVVNRGLRDLLFIGTQQRPDLFALDVRREAPFYAEVVEVGGRLDARGEEIEALALDDLRAAIAALEPGPSDAAAVALLHSYRRDDHEVEVAAVLRRAGWRHVTRSSEVAPRQGAVARAQTAVVNAYLSPVIDEYLAAVAQAVPSGTLRVMTSAGGLQTAGDVRPKDCLLSGPAGGVVGAERTAAACGERRLISFDMGGTSTDVARYDGEFDYRFDTELAGARVLAPALAIETVAAGGGSICRFEEGRLRVGPESAGARPGPACYGAGGPLALTDVNLLLGRLDPDRFEIPLSPPAAEERLAEVRAGLAAAGQDTSDEVLLAGLLQIANERMAEAIRRISVRRGYDPTDYALLAFGGAGGQHACAVAALLGMTRVLVPFDASVLSAWGLGHAVIERIVERQVLQAVEAFAPGAEGFLGEMAAEALRLLRAEGLDEATLAVRRSILSLRLEGQDATLDVAFEPRRPILEAFRESYRQRYGYEPPERPVEVESARVVASSAPPTPDAVTVPAGAAARPVDHRRCWVGGGWRRVPVHARAELEPGARLTGPALVVERFGVVVVESGWSGRVGAGETLILESAEVDR